MIEARRSTFDRSVLYFLVLPFWECEGSFFSSLKFKF